MLDKKHYPLISWAEMVHLKGFEPPVADVENEE